MQLRNLIVKNFRVLEDIDCELGPQMNVIVGPNAVGKSTVLQAIRLTKSLLAPRIQSEQQQTFISLGAASPHFPQRLFLTGLAYEASRPVEVRCTYLLSTDEVTKLRQGMSQVVQSVVAFNHQLARQRQGVSFRRSPRIWTGSRLPRSSRLGSTWIAKQDRSTRRSLWRAH